MHPAVGDPPNHRSLVQGYSHMKIRYSRSIVIITLSLSVAACGSAAVNQTLKPYRERVKLDSADAQAYYELGSAAISVGRYKEARRAFKRCLELDDTHINAYMKLAQSHLVLEEGHLAFGCYRRVLELDSMHVDANEQLGYLNLNQIILFESGSYFAEVKEGKEINSEQQRILNLTEMKYEEFLQLYPETEQIFLRLTRLEPGNAAHWCGLGAIRNQRETYEESIAAYNQALRLNPKQVAEVPLNEAIYRASMGRSKWMPPDPRFLIYQALIMQLLDMPEPPPGPQ
jgi:tetratricopeptide (TPR) repeat protein